MSDDKEKKISSPRFGIHSPKISFHSPKVTVSSPKTGPADENKFFSTGRGGAGNMGFGSPDLSPTLIPEDKNVHPLHQEVFTTGRGGAGNMRSAEDEKLVQKIQDEVKPAQELDPTKPTMHNASIGRGGFGNVRATMDAEETEKTSILQRMKDALSK